MHSIKNFFNNLRRYFDLENYWIFEETIPSVSTLNNAQTLLNDNVWCTRQTEKNEGDKVESRWRVIGVEVSIRGWSIKSRRRRVQEASAACTGGFLSDFEWVDPNSPNLLSYAIDRLIP